MGLYGEQVVPRLVDLGCGLAGLDRWRAQATEGLAGRVVEIGFGSGLNVPHYPLDVDVVLAVEPAMVARRMAERRIAPSRVPVTFVGLDGQHIPLDDASCDAALFTFTLCTVPDPEQALSELWRVVRPAAQSTSSNTGCPPNQVSSSGSAASNRSIVGLSAGAISPTTRRPWWSEPGSSWGATSRVTPGGSST